MTLQQLKLSAWPARAVTSVILFCAMLAFPNLANAELKLCNSTSSHIGVAIGYKDKEGWVSEGWWNVDTQSCVSLIQDKLRARFYYVYAFDYDKGGEWGGFFGMCTADAEFTIKGNDSCEGRGYKRSKFFEVDTQEQIEWTVRLTDQAEPTPSQADNANGMQTQAPSQAAVASGPATRRR